MKLVELLARDMSEWPDDLDTLAISQDRRTGMNRLDSGVEPHDAEKMPDEWGSWPSETWTSFSDLNIDQIADDYRTAIVTRAQWQAERDRQKGSGSHRFKQGDSVKVIASDETEWCRVGDIHKVRVCKTCPDGELVYVVNDDHESCWIRECNLELVAHSSDKSGEWKRHSGGKQPVGDDVRVEVKLRDGDIQEAKASAFLWNHSDCDVYANIMQFRIISQPQAEEVEVNAFVGKDVKIEYAYAQEGVEPEHLEWKTMGTAKIDNIFDLGPMEAKTYQIDGPIKWRDTVNELDAYIEEFTRERDILIERLASEGFALIPAIHPVMGVSDISFPIEEWQIGDIVEVVSTSDDSGAPLGVFTITDIDIHEPKYELDDSYFPNHDQMKFIRRP